MTTVTQARHARKRHVYSAPLNPVRAPSSAQAGEESIIKNMFSALVDLQRTDPAYFARLEDADVDTAPRAELADLMDSAPNERVKYFLFGKLSMRLAMAGITGRTV